MEWMDDGQSAVGRFNGQTYFSPSQRARGYFLARMRGRWAAWTHVNGWYSCSNASHKQIRLQLLCQNRFPSFLDALRALSNEETFSERVAMTVTNFSSLPF